MKTIQLIAVICAVLAATVVQAGDNNMKAFPPAEAGMVRHVLKMERQANESLFQVELIVGKTVQLDKGNSYFFIGSVAQETVEGWGFNYYKVEKLGPMGGTLMAVDPDEPKVDRFVQVNHLLGLLRYNSRLPIVVYAPEGVEVRYRIWRGEPEHKLMPAG
ncbi:MAG: ecotin family protein [Kiritimatiellae bacterium]|nr:ecotin family protein [Kiritimatiellia bacterium]